MRVIRKSAIVAICLAATCFADPPATQPDADIPSAFFLMIRKSAPPNGARPTEPTVCPSNSAEADVYYGSPVTLRSTFSGDATHPTTAPTTVPADPTMDFFLNTAATPVTQPAAADEPATRPAVLENKGAAIDSVPAALTLNNGTTVKGNASTTPDKPIRIWDPSIKDYRDVPITLIKSITAVVNWERDEPEWTFKESGSDIKIYTGKTYPARETSYVFVLSNDEKITGDVAAPIYIEGDGKTRTYVLHKRDKGEIGQKLGDLLYVKKIEFGK